ncbi:hypothetical protein FRC11_011922 [Ceratobasidium sp. 423]|nr:hypothetical protein FRC11_011922 [Ceratobasidium sp. 423]
MYKHKTLWINYTSYDVCRQQDLINPTTPSRFIFLPSEFDSAESPDLDTHPFLYAKVLGIYHADISYRGSAPRRMDFIHLDHVGYELCQTDEDNLDSFDFVDPNDVIRLAHVIPDFQSGLAGDLLHASPSTAHDFQEDGTDWNYYYINRSGYIDEEVMSGGEQQVETELNDSTGEPEDEFQAIYNNPQIDGVDEEECEGDVGENHDTEDREGDDEEIGSASDRSSDSDDDETSMVDEDDNLYDY